MPCQHNNCQLNAPAVSHPAYGQTAKQHEARALGWLAFAVQQSKQVLLRKGP